LSIAAQAADVLESANVRMDDNVTYLADALGTCERILKQPIPLTYTRWALLLLPSPA